MGVPSEMLPLAKDCERELWFLYALVPFARGSVFVSGISEFLFIIEEEHLQQLDSKLSFYKMVFITRKLFSASTSHANNNFI